MKRKLLTLCSLVLALASAQLNAAPLGTAFTYQGRLTDGGTANGSYDLTFKLFDALNGPSQVGTTVTNSATSLSNGLFTVALDFGEGMFTGSARWLEIGVRTNGSAGAYATLVPRQPLTPAPYATYAGVSSTVTNGAISVSQLQTAGAPANGQVLTFNGTSLAWQTPASTNAAWGLSGNSGTTSANFLGTLDSKALELRVSGARGWRLEPTATVPNIIGGYLGNVVDSGAQGATVGGGGVVGFVNQVSSSLGTVAGGSANIIQSNANDATITGGRQNAISTGAWGGAIGGGRNNNIQTNASYSTLAGGENNIAGSDHATVGGGDINHALGSSSTLAGGYDNTVTGGAATIGGGARNRATNDYSVIAGGENNIAGGDDGTVGGGYFNQASGSSAVVAGGQHNVSSGIRSTVSGGSYNDAYGFGSIVPGGNNNIAAGRTSFAAGNNAWAQYDGSFVWADSQNNPQAPFLYDEAPNQFMVRAGAGATFITAQDALRLYGWQPFLTIFDSNASNSRIRIQNVGGELVFQPESHVSGSNPNAFVRFENSGNVSVATLTIRGGADLAEPFEFTRADIAAGSVVIIDTENPGKLRLSDRPNDQRVAGIVSGANGINPGIALHQEGALDGGQNVALSGRVYVLADASTSPIKPGDLLTTSATPGHAMKVTDHANAQGAIIGKAMSALKEGKGMVLVLVTLQ